MDVVYITALVGGLLLFHQALKLHRYYAIERRLLVTQVFFADDVADALDDLLDRAPDDPDNPEAWFQFLSTAEEQWTTVQRELHAYRELRKQGTALL